MESLIGFSPCVDGEVPICEVDGRLYSMKYEHTNLSSFTTAVDRHPVIYITREMLHCIGSGDESRALFLPVHEPFFKQVAKLWFEQGITEALRFISTENGTNSNIIKVTAKGALKVIDSLSQIYNVFHPYTRQNKKILIESFSQTRCWINSPIRCISWHPHCTKIAVAASDDSVRIYSNDSVLVPILKSKLQRNVSCIAWRPLSASEIAIGCESCILIWTVDPNSVVTRPSTSNSYVLRRVNHSPVISIVWSPHGEYLVSAAANDATLQVWDVALDQACSLRRAGTAGNILLSISNDGKRLVAATSGLVFRVWECQYWNAERWTTATGHIKSACWSPCGSILLFATCNEPIVYSLCFEPGSLLPPGLNSSTQVFTKTSTLNSYSSPRQAAPLLDVSRIELDNGQLIGGLVHAMDWDPTGRYLAILFKDSVHVAIFMTRCKPTLNITPSSLVTGLPGEQPCVISFQKNFKEGACLSIAWSSGRLQYFPIIYSDLRVNDLPITVSANKSANFDSFINYSGLKLN